MPRRTLRMTRMTTPIKTLPKFGAVAGLALSLAGLAGPAFAQFGGPFTEQTGKDIYSNICQGCHMPDGKGSQGAGSAPLGYPALAGDKKLAAKAYPALVVVRGLRAMPEFGSTLSDAQVAEVVNYIRTSFGNAYADPITAEQVKPVRPVKAATGVVKPPG